MRLEFIVGEEFLMTNDTSVQLMAKIHQQGEFSVILQQYEF